MKKLSWINFTLLVVIILLFAIILPVASSKWMQRTLEKKSSSIDLNVTMYQREFTDLWEKITTLEKSFASKRVQTKNVKITEELRKKITSNAKRQMEAISSLSQIFSFPQVSEDSLLEIYENTIISNDDCNGMVWYRLEFQDVSMLMDPDTGVAISFLLRTGAFAEDLFYPYSVYYDGKVTPDEEKATKVNLKIYENRFALRRALYEDTDVILSEFLYLNYGIPEQEYLTSGSVTESLVSNIVNIGGVIFKQEYLPVGDEIVIRLGFAETEQLMPLD